MNQPIKLTNKATNKPITGLKTSDFIGVPKNHKIVEIEAGTYLVKRSNRLFTERNLIIAGILFFGWVAVRLVTGI